MRRDKAFEKFYIDELFKNKDSKITEREAKKIWESAQNQAVLEINEHLHDKEALKVKNTILGQEIAEWKDKAEHMQDFYTDAQKEIKLLRAVYDYSRAAVDTRSLEVLDILSCAIGCVERFDEETIESAVDWGNE